MTPQADQALSKNGITDTIRGTCSGRGKQRKQTFRNLKTSVKRLLRMTTLKNAGQRKGRDAIDWSTLDMEFMRIADRGHRHLCSMIDSRS